MKRLTLAATLLTIAAVFGVSHVGAADDYPNRPIVLVIPLPPGGTNDIMARAVSDKMSAALGQQIVIENRNAGGSGTVGTRQVAHAAPDGYTIMLGYTSTLATGPNLYKDVGYDPRKDFAPIGLIASAPALLLVYKDLPVHNRRRIDRADEEPPRSRFRSARRASARSITSLRSCSRSRPASKFEQIPEKGSNPLITDMIGGFVKVGFNPIPVSRAALDGGYIRALAVTSAKHSTLMPESADARRIRPAGFRRDFELWAAGAGRHAARRSSNG